MSSHLRIYLGPYVEGTFRDETREVEVTGCTNAKCQEYAKRSQYKRPSGKFCAMCADNIGKSMMVVPVHPSTYDVLGGREELTPLGYHDERIWLGSNLGPKSKGPPPRSFWHDPDECVVDLTTRDRETDTQWFEKRFAEDIGKLRAAYDNVTVKWGLRMYHI